MAPVVAPATCLRGVQVALGPCCDGLHETAEAVADIDSAAATSACPLWDQVVEVVQAESSATFDAATQGVQHALWSAVKTAAWQARFCIDIVILVSLAPLLPRSTAYG